MKPRIASCRTRLRCRLRPLDRPGYRNSSVRTRWWPKAPDLRAGRPSVGVSSRISARYSAAGRMTERRPDRGVLVNHRLAALAAAILAAGLLGSPVAAAPSGPMAPGTLDGTSSTLVDATGNEHDGSFAGQITRVDDGIY